MHNSTREQTLTYMTTQPFDKAFWEDRWAAASGTAPVLPMNPHVVAETRQLPVGDALDAGCGTGTEAVWLATQGWRVTGADISPSALSAAAERADTAGVDDRVEWVETDLTRWEPERDWDLVVTSYAHSTTGQLALYRRVSDWVTPGGTLLIVGHHHAAGGHDHAHNHPEGSTISLDEITGILPSPDWRIASAYESARTVLAAGRTVQLRDVIVRAERSTSA